jgi:GDP-4-dehydro-6-deoxy-D-mannose reductase
MTIHGGLMRILITGVTGFAGSHLAEALLKQPGMELFGLGRRGEWPTELEHLAGKVKLLRCDLCDPAETEAVLRNVRPDQIYHLAGYAHTGRASGDAEVVWTGNLTATLRLYEAIIRWGGSPRILYVGSGMVYSGTELTPQGYDESAVLRPLSPYGASKAAADLLSYQLTRDPGLTIVRVRPFNHIGPRQSPHYAVAHFAQQIAAIEAGSQLPVLQTGDLSPARDLTDVRDVVRAYILLMQRGRSGEVFNVGTGKPYVMQALSAKAIEVRQQLEPRRRASPAVLQSNITKLRQETGWVPSFTLRDSLGAILGYWRQRAREPVKGYV